MSKLVKPDIVPYSGTVPVQFACTCGKLRPITKIYFCRHCLKLRCGFCVCQEIDSIYCTNCLENMPSQEARLKKNKCSVCFDCPSCSHSLSTRATPATQRNPEDKSAPRKVYYFSCLNCRWTSRDVGMPDQIVASGGWPERENVYAHRLTAIQDWYKKIVLCEKLEKQDRSKKKMQRGKYKTMTDKMGLTAALVRKRAGLPELPAVKSSIKHLEPSAASEDVEELDPEIFTTALNLNNVLSIHQRLLQVETQPATVDKLFPIRKSLFVKRSQRCRVCEHNVSKPEYHPSSSRFKIQLLACYHIPDVRLVTVEPLRAGVPCEMILKLCNPTQHQTVVTFLPLPSVDEEKLEIQAMVESFHENVEKKGSDAIGEKNKSLLSDSRFSALPKQASLPEDPRLVNATVTGDVLLPASSVMLPARDDAAEYDDVTDTHNFKDDVKFVIWRKFNKVALKFSITPRENLKIGETVLVGFTMQHSYTNTLATLENKEPQQILHKAKIYITTGNLVGSE